MMDSFTVLPSLASSSKQERSPPKRSARRCLFGRDPEGTKQWLSERLEDMRRTEDLRSEKWGFDFHSETPCACASSEYVYTPVPAEAVPSFYRYTHYRKCDLSDNENRSPDLSDSDSSMEEVHMVSLEPFTSSRRCIYPSPPSPAVSSKSKRAPRTPRKEAKLTAYWPVNRPKRLQRSAKVEDLCGPRSPSEFAGPASRHLKAASQ